MTSYLLSRGKRRATKVEMRCKNYVGVACVNGACPQIQKEEYEEYSRSFDDQKCEYCWFYEGCVDCMFDGTKFCIGREGMGKMHGSTYLRKRAESSYSVFRGLIKEYNVRPADIVKVTGFPSTVFTDWKKGKSVPKGEKLQRIADFFGVTAEYLLTGKDMLCDFNLQMPIARNIRRFREKLEMPVEELADRLCIHPLAIIKMEQGIIVPISNSILEEMLVILQITKEELWLEKGEER